MVGLFSISYNKQGSSYKGLPFAWDKLQERITLCNEKEVILWE